MRVDETSLDREINALEGLLLIYCHVIHDVFAGEYVAMVDDETRAGDYLVLVVFSGYMDQTRRAEVIDELRADGGYVLEFVPLRSCYDRHIEITVAKTGNRDLVVTDVSQEAVVGETPQDLCHAEAAGCLVVDVLGPQVVQELEDGGGLQSATGGGIV